jgi:hypothetical protein
MYTVNSDLIKPVIIDILMLKELIYDIISFLKENIKIKLTPNIF